MKTATTPRERLPGRPLLAASFLAITGAILVAGLWPFNFFPRNDVDWLGDRNGIRVGRFGIAYTRGAAYAAHGANGPAKTVTIEIVVQAASERRHTVAQILSLVDGEGRTYFTIAQWKSQLILRSHVAGSASGREYAELGAGNVLAKGVSRFVTVVSSAGSTAIYVDGRLVASRDGFPILPAHAVGGGDLVVANSPAGDHPWTGELHLLAVYDGALPEAKVARHYREWAVRKAPSWRTDEVPALAYLFDERAGNVAASRGSRSLDLAIPPKFRPLHRVVLRPPWKEPLTERWFVRDVAVNVAGFVPFGFLFAALRARRGVAPTWSDGVMVALTGCGVSLAIELLQAYLPTRTSSSTDVICNTAGTILGVLLWKLAAAAAASGEKRPLRP